MAFFLHSLRTCTTGLRQAATSAVGAALSAPRKAPVLGYDAWTAPEPDAAVTLQRHRPNPAAMRRGGACLPKP